MDRVANSGGLYRRPSAAVGFSAGSLAPVKVEIEMEDELEEENAPLNKRMKKPLSPDQWTIAGNNLSPTATTAEYNPLAEPSPLGLRLKKSPSLLELIQMRLSQGNSSSLGSISAKNLNPNPREIVGSGNTAAMSSTDKLKASNFPACLLRIGNWEYATKYEGDLVAKCYFAKHKLVWEILDGGLKSKIEIQWSDIIGLNAKFPEDGPATMTIVLARQPIFFRETNPQPRKHTLWQASTDFTNGQASMHRQHFLQIPNGVLNKHFEKLIQCDMRLNFLSHQPDMVIDSPYFESLPPSLKDSKKYLQTHNVDQSLGTSISASPNGSPSISQSSSVNTQPENYPKREDLSHETLSPSSGCVSSDSEALAGPENWEQLVMQGLKPSMSMTDLVNHIGSCISGEKTTEEGSESHKILENIAQHLLCDSQVATCSDEKSLMSRVNSLCCLLQKDGDPVQTKPNKDFEGPEDLKDTNEGDAVESSSFKPTMSRKDSYGDLLLSLPRIASLPKFLFDISEDAENQAW